MPPIPKQAHLVPGYRIADRYELLYPFAEGGMARVWLAQVLGPRGPERLVAVKTILPDLAGDKGFRVMFLDEAGIVSRIHHPHVAETLDVGEERGTPYLVFEWISGDTWSKLWAALRQAGHPFPLDPLLRIAADACAGLHAAHELRDDKGALREIVHRDISPQNILITSTGVTKVIDFGIARAVGRMAPKTRAGLLKGKLLYAAPEQLRAKGVDRRADVWAIGTILYQCLSGKLPYERETEVETLEVLLSGRPPPALPPEVPAPVVRVVMTALAAAPEARFATALDMQRALEAVISRPTTSAEVGALMQHYLADRIEMRRQDLAEALAEVEALRAGQPAVGPAAGAPGAVMAGPVGGDVPVRARAGGWSAGRWTVVVMGALILLGALGVGVYLAVTRM